MFIPARLPAYAISLLFWFLLPLFQTAAAQERPFGDVTAVAKTPQGVVFSLSGGAKTLVSPLSPDIIRIRTAPDGVFESDASYAVVNSPSPLVPSVSETKESVVVSTPGGATVVVARAPFRILIQDSRGRTALDEDPSRRATVNPLTGEISASFRRAATDLHYGFGEKALPLSRHGQAMTMWNTDMYRYAPGQDPLYQSIPFFITLRGGLACGVLFDNSRRTFFDMGKSAPERFTFGAPGGELNYYVFTGGEARSPKKILEDYTLLTGRTPPPPLWALGFHQSRFSYVPEAQVRDVVKGFRDQAIPLDALHFDIDYMDGFRVFTWDAAAFPNPQKLLGDLRGSGVRAVVIIDPGVKVDESYGVYRSGADGGHFLRTADGNEARAGVWPGVCAFPDFTRPETREWFGAQYRNFLKDGVAGFWNDMNEPSTFIPPDLAAEEPETFDNPRKTLPGEIRHYGDGVAGDHARYHNVYGMQMARATFEGLKRLRPQARPFVLTRAGYAGVQRYAAVWTGDTVASWEHLKLSIPMLLNLGVSGVPFAGADVGGFAGNPSAELYARWLQAASLTPFFRAHSEKGTNPHEPFAFGAPFTDVNRATIALRYRLLPYLYTAFHEHARTGAPVMRPLWFEYPTDVRASLIDTQYLVGRDVMVAPALEEGTTKRRAYFPKGDDWIDWRTGKRYAGGEYAVVEAPLDSLPIFLRVGAAAVTQSPGAHTEEASTAPLTVVVAVGGSGESVNVEDAGDGFQYEAGDWRRLAVRQSSQREIFITPTSGAAKLSFPARPIASVELLGAERSPQSVTVNGRAAKRVAYDAKTRRVSIECEPTTEPMTVVWR
jgi:alpha-glucosidase